MNLFKMFISKERYFVLFSLEPLKPLGSSSYTIKKTKSAINNCWSQEGKKEI